MRSISQRYGLHRQVTKTLARSLFSVVLTLVLIEILAQFLFFWANGYWIFQGHPFTFPYVKAVDTAERYVLDPNLNISAPTVMTTTENGLRTTPASTGELVVCAGDSVVFGWGVNDNQSWCSLLGSFGGLHTVNAGVPSYNFEQTFAHIKLDVLPKMRPAVLIIHAANDYTLFGEFGTNWHPGINWSSYSFGLHNTPELSATVYYLDNLVFHPVRPGNSQALYDYLSGVFADNLSYLNSLGIRVILLSINVDPKSAIYRQFKPIIDGINAVIQTSAKEYGAEFVDTRGPLTCCYLTNDSIHYNVDGNTRLARFLYSYIEGF